ncbi:MAG: protein kinase [Polaromonas sp.]|nr:protein kinase [Polaromonas sp.]
MSLKKLGRYELLRVIGKGAMGLIYKASDPSLGRFVAIKTISVGELSEVAAADYELRFRNEARSAGRLQHANIVSVYDAGRDGDTAYLVMELVDGKDLKHYLDNGERYSLAQSLAIMQDLLAALGCAHSQNVVHRDVKPANLLVERGGRIKLTDFGVAHIRQAGDATRNESTMVGTLKYMSPEQVKGLAVDSRADIFAAGVVLYQLLTGHRPFAGKTDFEIIQKIVGHQPLPASARNRNLPGAIDRVVTKAIAKPCEERYQTAAEFALALLAACQDAGDLNIPPRAVRSVVTGSGTLASADGEGLVGLETDTDTNTNTNTNTNTPSRYPGSITQELELVYWKDVRQSAQPRDLQLFIEKFPNGIYIDLALRRLQTLQAAKPALAGGGSAADGERDSAQSDAVDFAARSADLTVVMHTSAAAQTGFVPSRSAVQNRSSEPVHATQPDATDSTFSFSMSGHSLADFQAAAAPALSPVGAAVSSMGAGVGVGQLPVPVKGYGVQPQGSRRRRKSAAMKPAGFGSRSWLARRNALWLTAALALGVIGALFGVWQLLPSDSGNAVAAVGGAAMPALPKGAPVTGSPSAVPPGQAPLAEPASTPAKPPAAATLPGANPKAASASEAPAAPASLSPVAVATRVPAAGKSRTGASAPQPMSAQSRAATEAAQDPVARSTPQPAVAAPTATPASPRTECENRVLLGFQICLTEQCAKPAFSGHPVCRERGAMEERRREAEQLR